MTELHDQDRPIGVFDSGIGGLTVASELHRRLPSEEIIYLGDTARVPYGTKSKRAVNSYALECALFLLNSGVKLIVAACNTVSSIALPRLQERLKAPIIGVLDPGAAAAVLASKSGRIGVIGTPSTIRSRAYPQRLVRLKESVQVWGKACPLLVPMAEEGRLEGVVVETVLSEYLGSMKNRSIDTLILGCTHYPLFKPVLRKVLGEGVELIDSAEAVAGTVEETLLREGMLRTHGSGSLICCVTDVPSQFKTLGRRFFGDELGRIQRVSLGS